MYPFVKQPKQTHTSSVVQSVTFVAVVFIAGRWSSGVELP